MAIARVRKGDTVVVIAGKERGKRGKVLRVIPGKGRVLIEHVNMIKKHQRPTQKLRQGGIIEREGSIHVSNIALWDAAERKAIKAGIKIGDDGSRVRVNKKTGAAIPDPGMTKAPAAAEKT